MFIRYAIKNCLNVAGECCANVNQLLFSSLKPQIVTFVMSEINDKTKTKMLYKCHDINQKLTIYKGINVTERSRSCEGILDLYNEG